VNWAHLVIGTKFWRKLKEPKTPEHWRTALLLPDTYTIEKVIPGRKEFWLVVSHPALPTGPQETARPLQLVPRYCLQDSEPALLEVAVQKYDEATDMYETCLVLDQLYTQQSFLDKY
jgi:hypothetical protein